MQLKLIAKMSDSEVNFDALKASEAESSDDEPLVAKKISSPKKAKLPKKKSKKDKKKSKLNKKAEKKPKVAEVSFSLVPTKSKKNESETEAEYEVSIEFKSLLLWSFDFVVS